MSDGTSRPSACRRCFAKSSTASQRNAGMPNASASRTKSGFVKSVPKCSPNFLSCFQTIDPYWLFSQTMFTIGVFRRTAVSSSWQFMRKPPSPLTVTTLRSGWTSFAAIAQGSAKPIPARPFAMSTVLGSCAGNIRPIHSLWSPTSEIRMSSRPSARRISHSARGGCIGKASSSRAASKRLSTTSRSRWEAVLSSPRLELLYDALVEPLRAAAVRDVAAPLGQPRDHVVDVADELDLGLEVLVDLRRLGIDDHDLLVAPGVPVRRGMLDEVVADRDDHVGVFEAGHRVVARVEADRAQRMAVVGIDDALAHERLGDRDAGRAAELAQRGRGPRAPDAGARHD